MAWPRAPSAPLRFARALAVCVCCYVPWGWLSDVPSNYEAWRKDQAAGKRYFGFWDGLMANVPQWDSMINDFNSEL